MKYFLDTEFIEGKQKESFPISLFRKHTPETIDLISIGIVSENGRSMYEICKEFNLKEAWNRHQYNLDYLDAKEYWLRENVLYPIWKELFLYQESDYALLNKREAEEFELQLKAKELNHLFTYKSLKGLLQKHGKTKEQIAERVLSFVFQAEQSEVLNKTDISFYAYFADYDWVVFCWLFGAMNNLPKGFPMYCNDLKQILDEKAIGRMPVNHQQNIFLIKQKANYPKKENEHNALADAKWNKKLYAFLNKL